MGPHRWVQHSRWRRQAAHGTLPGRAQPLGTGYLLPLTPLDCPGILEPPLGRQASCIRPIHGRCQGWACPPPQTSSPPPCSTMRGALRRAGVQGTSRQGQEAGTSLDQVGTLSTSDQKDPHLSVDCLSSSEFALYFEFCIFSLCIETTSDTGAVVNGHRLHQLLL